MDQILLLAPAKINLILQILGKREDGYHEIRTLMQQVTLFDEIFITVGGEGIKVQCDSEDVPANEENIVWKAARLVLDRTEKRVGLRIWIKKRIPVAAGLGGGSSDAATTIMGLQRLLDIQRSKEELIEWGATIGADVPFFIFGSPAIATGYGERLEKVDFSFVPWYVLISFPFRVSTEWVYSQFNLRLTKGGFRSNIPPLFHKLEELTSLLKNDLESVTENMYVDILQAKKELLSRGAKGALMTGSGPTVLGIFPDEASARTTYNQIRSIYGWDVFLVKGIQA